MNAVQNAGYLDRMAYAMQEERDNAMVFMSAASPQTTSYLFDQYKYTDYVIVSTPWPNRLDVNSRPEYTTKMAFQVLYCSNSMKPPFETPPTLMSCWIGTSVVADHVRWYCHLTESQWDVNDPLDTSNTLTTRCVSLWQRAPPWSSW